MSNELPAPNLSNLQIEILRTWASHKPKTLTNALLTQLLEKKDPTITFASLQSLQEKKLINLTKPQEGNRRFVDATDKGAIYAFRYCDVDYEKWVQTFGDRTDRDQLGEVRELILTHKARSRMYRVKDDYILRNNLFDNDGSLILRKGHILLLRTEFLREALRIENEDPQSVNMPKIAKWQRQLEKEVRLEGLLDQTGGQSFTLGRF